MPLFRYAALLALACAAVAAAQEQTFVFRGAHIIPIDGPEIDRGVLVVQGGKITAVGPESDLAAMTLPADAEHVDCAGRVIMPGLVDTHNHIGGVGGGDRSGPIQPECRVLDSINCRASGFKRALAGGLTTLNLMPGSGHLLSGQTLYVKLRPAATIEQMAFKGDDGRLLGGIKMANGTNSIRDEPFPGTRAKSAALVRQRYIAAQEYRDKIARAAGDPDKMPERDLALEALVEALEGKRIVHHHTHRHDDIMTVLRLRDEFGLRIVLHHVSEGWKVAEQIAAAGAPCSIIVIDSPGGKLEAVNLSFETGGVLERAGVNVAFHTDDWITDSRLFLRSAALGVRAGMSRAAALRALTLAGAEMLDLQERVGSLTPGKDADFVILDGDPLSVYAKVQQTWVEGQKVFDRSDPDDYLYAVGGYGAGDDTERYLCCFEAAN